MGEPVVEAVVAPQPGTPEYEAAMASKVDDSAAKALEAAEGTPLVAPEEKPKEVTEEAPAEGAKKEESEEKPKEGSEAEKAVAAAGLDYSALQSEWEAGGLSEESYKALEKVGFSKDIVDQHIAGMEALAQLAVMQATEAAGGADQLAAMQQWAASSFTKEEAAAYNQAVAGGKDQMLKAVGDLRTRYEAEYGRAPALLGGRNASEGKAGYASRAEMTNDMRDPRYAKDPAFRAKVTAKIAATTAF